MKSTCLWNEIHVSLQDYLYVTDWRLDAIIRMDKTSGEEALIVEKVEESNRLYGKKLLKLVSAAKNSAIP